MNLFFSRFNEQFNKTGFVKKRVRFCWSSSWRMEKLLRNFVKRVKKDISKIIFTTNGKPGFEVYGILAVIIIMSYSENVSVIK